MIAIQLSKVVNWNHWQHSLTAICLCYFLNGQADVQFELLLAKLLPSFPRLFELVGLRYCPSSLVINSHSDKQ